jgi:hypothetical protein
LKRFQPGVATIALTFNAALIMHIIYRSGHFPVYNIFESFITSSFILGCLALFYRGLKRHIHAIRSLVWLEIPILMALARIISKEQLFTGFDYDYVNKFLFHFLRAASMSVMLYATAYYLQSLKEHEHSEWKGALAHMGRNFLLLGTTLYLLAEYTGVIWCQAEFGDFWTWTHRFLISTIMMFYLMVAFHIPGTGRRAEDLRAFTGGMGGIFFVSLTILSPLLWNIQ